MKISLPAGPKGVENYLDTARHHGFTWIDISGSSPDNFPETFDPVRTKNLRARLEEYGLGCGIHTASYVNSAEIFAGIRKGVVDHFKEFIDLARGEAFRFMTQDVSQREWCENVRLEVVRLGEEQEMFHLKLLYLDLFIPLTVDVRPEMEGLEEPEFRLFRV